MREIGGIGGFDLEGGCSIQLSYGCKSLYRDRLRFGRNQLPALSDRLSAKVSEGEGCCVRRRYPDPPHRPAPVCAEHLPMDGTYVRSRGAGKLRCRSDDVTDLQ